MPSRPTKRLIGLGVAAAVALALWFGRGEREAAPQAAASPPPPSGRQFFSPVPESGLAVPSERAARRRQLVEPVQLTDHTLSPIHI